MELKDRALFCQDVIQEFLIAGFNNQFINFFNFGIRQVGVGYRTVFNCTVARLEGDDCVDSLVECRCDTCAFEFDGKVCSGLAHFLESFAYIYREAAFSVAGAGQISCYQGFVSVSDLNESRLFVAEVALHCRIGRIV